MRQTHSLIELKSSQIESWVNNHFDAKPRKDGEELRICNPFNGDTGYHFNISVAKGGICNDWRGNEWVGINPRTGEPYKCTFFKFVQLYLGCSWESAVKDVLGSSFSFRDIRRQQGEQKLRERREGKEKASLGLPVGARELLADTSKLATSIKHWLETRGIDTRKLVKYKLLYSGWNAIWPYYEYDELVYWQSRSRLNKRFEFPPESIGVTKGQFLYGFDQVEPSNHVVITEAIIDAQTIEEQAIATGGASLTQLQVKKIKVLNPREGIILAPDNDWAGLASILSNAKMLRRLKYPILYAIPPEIPFGDDVTKDWNDVGKAVGFAAVRRTVDEQAKPLTVQSKLKIQKMITRLKVGKPIK